MSQYSISNLDGRPYEFGYDKPCGGYFAQDGIDPELEGNSIGFAVGVDLHVMAQWLGERGVTVPESMMAMLVRDEENAGPLSELQELMRVLFASDIQEGGGE